jgi:glucose/arabinose dehydrogenase
MQNRAAIGLALVMATTSLTAAWPQAAPAPAPKFPPGPGYAGVAGSAEENARITALCGANRNAQDGYVPTPAFAGQTRAPKAASRQPFTVEPVAKFDRPWGLAALPDGRFLVAIRAGGVRLVGKDGSVSEPLAGSPEIKPAMLSAMYDVALDRDFAKNHTVYLGWVTRDGDTGNKPIGRVASAKLSADGKSLTDLKVLHEASSFVPRRIVQARDGTLLIPSGEVASGGPNPQSLTSEMGKIVRVGADGSVPKDNPFAKDPKADPALYAVGFRDIHGAAIEPATGKLWVAENTPMGGDELNLIKPGGNYGFPVISYGRENGGGLINGGKTVQDGMEQPVYFWNPSIAPASLLFYTGSALPGWKGSVFVGGLSGKQLVRLEMKGGKVVGEEKLLLDKCSRIKTAIQGPDGLIYVMTDEPKAELWRIRPAKKS